ncbi:homeobox protein Hox-C8-like [Rhincodon typus]|uniref:homeobox protein Hox-C8-like n=1 Tax=Rhincodon typus TaxID=259920 RepID=UPI00202EFA3A|nr:homeobox protein Hox-C8-like [Rhincodon typus]XP_048450088.1 homeobox protein Hox-C8-like [Rhincodon typus]
MSSYFVNPLFTKYKPDDALDRTNYYDGCFPHGISGEPALMYGAVTRPAFQPVSGHIQDYFHTGGSSLPASSYQQGPCGPSCQGETAKFYGYDALGRQNAYAGGQTDAALLQYPECKAGVPAPAAAGSGSEGPGAVNPNSPASLMFPWMRPHG